MISTPVTEDRGATLVTGATSGIGLELARVLAAKGHALAIVARDSQRTKTVAGELEAEYYVPVTWFAKDLANPTPALGFTASFSTSRSMRCGVCK